MDAFVLLLFVLGLALLVGGSELLVRGGANLARIAGVSPLVVGLTVVAFATSSPELAVGVQAALSGQPDIIVGNVVGSNIFNVLCVLGLSAVVAPLVVSRQLIRLDVPVMVVVSFLFLMLASDASVSRLEGLVLFIGLLIYTFWSVRAGRKEARENGKVGSAGANDCKDRGWRAIGLNAVLVVGGMACLVIGSDWLVDGAVGFARLLGVSELVIGLTIIAVGTSLPELATSIAASLSGEREIAVGNAVGSNTFNILSVLAVSAIAAPSGVAVSAPALRLDIPVMLAVAVACLPIFFRGHTIARWEGGLLLGYYVAYTLYQILAATQADLLPAFSAVMLAFVLPITGLTLLVLTARYAHQTRRAAREAVRDRELQV